MPPTEGPERTVCDRSSHSQPASHETDVRSPPADSFGFLSEDAQDQPALLLAHSPHSEMLRRDTRTLAERAFGYEDESRAKTTMLYRSRRELSAEAGACLFLGLPLRYLSPSTPACKFLSGVHAPAFGPAPTDGVVRWAAQISAWNQAFPLSMPFLLCQHIVRLVPQVDFQRPEPYFPARCHHSPVPREMHLGNSRALLPSSQGFSGPPHHEVLGSIRPAVATTH